MSATKKEPPATDPTKMSYAQLDALAQEAIDSDNPAEYQYSVVEEYMERARERRVESRMEMEVGREAERDLQRWLKYQREVGIHKAFARDYARYMARISC